MAIGVVLAASAVVGSTAALAGGEALPTQASTMLGYPNGAGMVLVATGLVTLHLHREGRISGVWLGAPPRSRSNPRAHRGEPRGATTTHVHDELLQLAVEFGLPALALTLVVVALLAVRIERRPLSDIHLGVACAGLASLALTDFALRITADALVLAVVVLFAWRNTATDPVEEPTRAAGSPPRMPVAAGCARDAAS